MSCGSGFIRAEDARIMSRDNKTIFTEICGIQQAILTAIDMKQLSVYVKSGTPITNDTLDEDYYKVFMKQKTDRAITDQFEFITQYFTDLGYVIKLQLNPNTQSSLQWYITW
ncbi:hypothetical protein Cassandra_0036 [Pseudomonas phage Cassandra]|uniref:Structural protein n=1 Tax=Pseudomonas phage vB_PaeM_PA5oct TaxID=2163605 RepID=A0A4Y5JUK2_9CAUD|nr:structural protein [Pseudomonas phage vB_PaeM_PA5oct]WMI31783.1 hypothetical protein GBBBJNDB_00080 [Pseudomonas phage Callisto]WPK38712.1 hypothetical protein Cassandra_0036 [Pseudomonas phage Cassandra]WPK39233.1 hypothetical protein Deiofobo_0036 [Pseudomonas phage Deifobo]WPK39745.1 hypothetical protein ETTORE_0036 [Pseudomonas phage Ettore]WPK40266.1 hypothetical protein Paride_0036 [Pseudomonas phage Paride]